MAKAPSEARVPSGGKIPVPKATKGAVRRTIQGGLSAGSRLLPTKIKLPLLKCKLVDTNKKLIENSNDNESKICSDVTPEKIPVIAGAHSRGATPIKDRTFSMCDKTDPEKTFDVFPDLINTNTIDIKNVDDVKQKKGVKENKRDECVQEANVISLEVNKLKGSIGSKVTAIIPEDSTAVRTISGILRYVGRVQIDDDIWCGIETDGPSRELHDGSLNGVKYFSCKNGHGLLVPCAYVLLQCQNQFVPDPKILELRKRLQYIKSKSSKSLDDNFRPNVIDITQQLVDYEYHQSDSGPYSLLVGLDCAFAKPVDHLQDIRSEDFTSANQRFQAACNSPTYQHFNSQLPNLLKNLAQCNKNVELIEDESVLDFAGISMNSIVDHSLQESRRKSSIISQPRNVNNQLYDTPDSNKINNLTKSTPLPEEPERPVQNDRTKDFEISKKCIRIAKQYDNRQFKLHQPARKQNAQPPTSHNMTIIDIDAGKASPSQFPDYRIKTSVAGIGLLSPTVSDNSNQELSKQNSFEESLGILTPEQMESLSFLENIFSPSRDDFGGLLSSDKVTEKTESSSTQTPTDNIKSLTPDAFKLLLNPSETCRIIEEDLNDSNDKNTLEKTIVYSQADETFLKGDQDNLQSESYEMFIQRPFKQSTSENLTNINDLCSQTIDDELLPSVHSSILDALSSIVDTTRFDNIQHNVRMDQTPSPEELPLDPVDIKSELSALSTDPKTDTSKSVTYSITSITSLDGYQGDGEMSRPVSRGADQSPTIGHRGVNNIQNWQNIPINRRPDPMTDSDFFTESDADGHDEQVHRGDRRAQVIDGALYGGGKASNPPVLVSRNGNSNNDDSCMESSGVFTDMETHRCSPLLLNVIDDLSPEGSSPSTRSDLSQNNNSEMYRAAFNDTLNNTVVAANSTSNLLAGDEEDKENSPMQLKSPNTENKNNNISLSNSPNEKMNKEDKNMALKKYKMPRRDVASKVKSMMSSSSKSLAENQEKQNIPKKEGRWDAVMNKISVNKTETKSKFYMVKPKVNSSQSSEKTSFCEDNSSMGKPKAKASLTKLKSRRVKSSRMPKISMLDSSSRSTPHSSQSDLSVSCSAPTKIASAKHIAARAAKKRDTSVAGPGRTLSPTGPPGPPAPSQNPPAPHLTPRNRTPPAANGRPVNSLVKKPIGVTTLSTSPSSAAVNNVAASKGVIPQRKPIARRAATQLSPRTAPLKDQNRASSPGSVLKAPPGVGAAPPLPPAPQPPPTRGVEALAVLVQYLVFQLDALNAPRWKVQATNAKAQLAEAAGRLQRVLSSQRADHNTLTQSLSKITQLEDELRAREDEHNSKIIATITEAEKTYKSTLEESTALSAEIRNLKSTLSELKHDVAESRTRVVRAEDATRKHIAEKTALLHDLELANEEVKRLRLINDEAEKALTTERQEAQLFRLAQQEIKDSQPKPNLEDANLSPPRTKESKMAAEIQSLKSVLDMKMEELSELRKKHEDYKNAAEQLPSALQRNATLSATVEDLRTQLNRKLQDEINLLQQNKQLQESFSRESAMKNRLSLHNEELQYRLMQNSEVVNLLAAHSVLRNDQNNTSIQRRTGIAIPESTNQTFPGDNFVRGQVRTTASFNEKYLHSTSLQDRRGEWRTNLRRASRSEGGDNKISLTDKKKSSDYFQSEDLSPPNSPKVKGVVEKNDSVSWVLEIETPEEMVSRIVRRAGSFRVSTSPPAREATKRQRSRPKGLSTSASPHSLAQSASASCLEPTALRSTNCKLFRSNSIEHNQYIPSRPIRTSTPRKNSGRQDLHSPSARTAASSFDSVPLSNRETFIEKQSDNILDNIQVPCNFNDNASIENEDLVLLPECESVPKESAGEALISGANSEDDSSLDEPSPSSSDSESGSECGSDKYLNLNGAGDRLADPVLQKIAETMDQSLSATPMDVSWSEDGVMGVSESDI
ncbi:uncharacterized protein LOC143911235 [Arctopsyche grandis]|uniref:uncharacterized protein LOC143911235 n=1 Tax=Arctopsyche grandis TaxID=121162 RepID=UPI00406D7FA9